MCDCWVRRKEGRKEGDLAEQLVSKRSLGFVGVCIGKCGLAWL